MVQPVVDTLRLSETPQEAGVDRAQADGLARALGDELGEHVVARAGFDAGFEGIRAEFKSVRSEMAVMRTQLDARIDALRASLQTIDSKLRYMIAGMGLMLAFLSAITGLVVYQRPASHTAPPPQAVWLVPAPSAIAQQTSAPTDPADPTD